MVMPETHQQFSRRQLLRGVTCATVGLAGVGSALAQAPRESVDPAFQIKNKRIRQSVMGWCFN